VSRSPAPDDTVRTVARDGASLATSPDPVSAATSLTDPRSDPAVSCGAAPSRCGFPLPLQAALARTRTPRVKWTGRMLLDCSVLPRASRSRDQGKAPELVRFVASLCACAALSRTWARPDPERLLESRFAAGRVANTRDCLSFPSDPEYASSVDF